MFKNAGVRKRFKGLAITFGILALQSFGQAATIGQWSGNSANTVWSSSSAGFSSIYAAATAASVGHTVETPEAITSESLKNNTHFIINAPTSLPSAGAITALRDWVMGGGVLLLMTDPSAGFGGTTATGVVNQILSQLGSNLSSSTSPIGGSSYSSYGQLQGSGVPVNGSAGNLAGGTLSSLRFNVLGGGTGFGTTTALNNLIRVGGLTANGSPGIGQIYLFGNGQLASNGAIANNTNNRTFFLNLLGQSLGGVSTSSGGGGGGGFDENPEPGTVSLLALGIASLVWYRKRKKA